MICFLKDILKYDVQDTYLLLTATSLFCGQTHDFLIDIRFIISKIDYEKKSSNNFCNFSMIGSFKRIYAS
ncbi:hypothetical protein KUTeg_014610 [Tegillarca granosa]|uniref:Uncharacterized protein n=1 Tax=Tegillarca granosa TaxID=220873 RepID=A0ABQ9EW72_TEGGR|nr:hypothetical protein KUTeg_014610 [Tegillarca granosa]